MKIKSTLLLSVTLLAIGASNVGAATIFSETMGTVSATTTIAAHETANGFDNDSFTFSGTGDLRATTASGGYTGASASANALLSTTNRSFQIDGISTVGYMPDSIDLSFGAYKSTTASNMTTLKLEYSTNGSAWTALTIPAQATGSGTAVWRLVSLASTNIPISGTLSLKWTNNDSSGSIPNYRIDDIILSGTPVPETSAALFGALGMFGFLRRRR